MEDKKQEVSDLQDGRQIQMMYSDERARGSGDEDSNLVYGVVLRIKVAEPGEWRLVERKQQGWGNSLVDTVFRNVDNAEREHAIRRVKECTIQNNLKLTKE